MIASGKNEEASSSALLVLIQDEHKVERRLCDKLERIADGLPGDVDRSAAVEAVDVLRHCLKRHIALEEKYLLPMLVSSADTVDNAEALRVQIVAEHSADEALANDIVDELDQMIESGRVRNPEMLGFMLHGFFECRRRHLAWENTVVIPLAIRRLATSDWRSFSVTEFESEYGETEKGDSGAGTSCGCGCGDAPGEPKR